MAKKITVTDIKNDNKKFTEKKKVILSDEYYVHIYPNFSLEAISELINEIISDPKRAKDEGIDFNKINMGDWSMFNIVYKFSDLGIPSDIKKKVQVYTELIKSNYWTKIVESFPIESINKVKVSLDNYYDNLQLLKKELESKSESVSFEKES